MEIWEHSAAAAAADDDHGERRKIWGKMNLCDCILHDWSLGDLDSSNGMGQNAATNCSKSSTGIIYLNFYWEKDWVNIKWSWTMAHCLRQTAKGKFSSLLRIGEYTYSDDD
jgi:hypothetical protein